MTSASQPSLAATSAEITPVSLMGHGAARVDTKKTAGMKPVEIGKSEAARDDAHPLRVLSLGKAPEKLLEL